MKIKETMSVVVTKYSDEPSLAYCKQSDDFFTVLGRVDVEVEFDMPSGAIINGTKIEAIKTQIEKVRAENEVKVERLEGEIQKLMAIKL